MPFDWKDFLDLAEGLLHQAGRVAYAEALIRSTVSRAYFGAYGHARNYAKDFLDFDPREDADDHGRLKAHLKNRRRKGDADRLGELRHLRNEADYINELPWTNPTATAAHAISEAKAVFTGLAPPKKA